MINQKNLKTAVTKAVSVAMGICMMATVAPTTVLAANGVQDPAPNGYTYTTTDASGAGTWDANDGKVDLTYDTTGGTWKDSQYPDGGTDEEKAKHTHPNGTYVVRIPKAIKYTGMNVGTVNTSDDYDVTVEGVLASGKSVDLKAQTNQDVAFQGTAANANDKITETTSLKDGTAGGAAGAYSDTNFHNFSASQVSVLTDDKAKIKGTTVKDNIAMKGTAYSAGTYKGSVQYTASLK